MKSGCKPKKTLRMAVGGAFSSSLQAAYDKQAKDFARVPTATTPVGGDFGPGRNPRDPNNRPVATPGGNELNHTMGPENMARPAVEPITNDMHVYRPTGTIRPAVESNPTRDTTGPESMGMRPAVEPHTMASTPQQSLRSAVAPTLTPSALEQRLNDRMNAGTLTIRGAGMLQGIEDSRRQADVQRYGIDTSADTAKLGYKNQMDIAGMNNQTNIRGQDLNYNLGQQGLKNQWDLGVLGSNTTIRGQDLNYNLGVMGNNTTIRGQDLNYDLGVMGNNTQNSIADKNRQTALADMQNRWNMNQYNQDANTFNNLANNRSRTFGLRNGGEIHAANGFMPGGYAELGRSIKWLSPYDGIKATAALADMDLKQDYMRAQTEALRAQTERADRGPTQDEVNAAKMTEDQARQRFLWEEEDRTTRNKMTQTAFDTKMRNDLQDRQMALADREHALNSMRSAPDDRRVDEGQSRQEAYRAAIAAHNREQEAKANAWTASRQAEQAQSQALADQQRQEDGLRQRADHAAYLANEQAKADRIQANNRYQADTAANTLATLRANALQDQDRQTEQARYAQAQALGRAAQQPGMAGRPEDWNGNGYRTHGGADQNSIDSRALMVEGQQAAMQARANQLRDYQAQQSMQLQNDYAAQERAKRDDAYIAQSRSDARNRQITGDTYALEDRARHYDMLQQANARLNSDRRAPMMTDPRFTDSRGLSRFGLRNGGSPAIDSGIGGVVPGTGKGDKIPAKYEPGEFVVSNDMLKAEPELRDHLRSLREQVLAAKGMTVQEADAKAVGRGRGLRAWTGYDGVDGGYTLVEPEDKPWYRRIGVGDTIPVVSAEDDVAGPSEKAARIAERAVVKAAESAATREARAPSGPPDAHLREYANQVVSDDDRAESDRLTRSVMTGGRDAADINLRRLNEDPEARDTYNRALGLRGAGIRVDQGENGPVFSNSTGTEKLRYTGADGRATNNWRDTQEYKDSIGRTQKTQALADRMERDRTRRELEQQEAMMTDAAMNGDRQAAAQLQGVRSLRGEMMRTEAAERAAMAEQQAAQLRAEAPARLKEQERLRNASIMEAAGGDPVKAERLAATIGADTKPYSDMISNAQTRGAHARDQEDKSYDRLAKRVSGLLTPSGDEKADTARQSRVANSIVTMHPEIAGMDPDEVQKKLPRLVAEASILDKFDRPSENGWESWAPDFLPGTKPLYAGRKSLPPKEDLVGAKLEAPVSGLRGAFTPGDTEKGNIVLYLPNHRNINLGTLGAEELSFINELVDEANGKPKKRKAQ